MVVAGVVCMTIFVFWQMGETSRRADRVHRAIQPGMAYTEVAALIPGRHFCAFQIQSSAQWRTVSREEFAGALSNDAARLHLLFLGMTPARASFFVELDRAGKVTTVTASTKGE